MSREIKFRGMDVDGNWHIGNLAILPEDVRHLKKGHYISNEAGLPFAYKVRPETVGQYTGNKNRGFEGDIISYIEPYRGEHGDIIDYDHLMGMVEWDNERSGFILRCSNGNEWLEDLMNITVVGNIHDNPELIHGT
ncbi:YopX protein [compost metagenome]